MLSVSKKILNQANKFSANFVKKNTVSKTKLLQETKSNINNKSDNRTDNEPKNISSFLGEKLYSDLFKIEANPKVSLDEQADMVLEELVKKIKGYWFNKDLPEDFVLSGEVGLGLNLDYLDTEDKKDIFYDFLENIGMKGIGKDHVDYTLNKYKRMVANTIKTDNEKGLRIMYLGNKNGIPLTLKRYYPEIKANNNKTDTMKIFFYLPGKIKDILKAEKYTDDGVWGLGSNVRAIMLPVASLFLYNQVLNYIRVLAKESGIDTITIPEKTITDLGGKEYKFDRILTSLDKLLDIIMTRLVDHALIYEVFTGITFNNFSKKNILTGEYYKKGKRNIITYVSGKITIHDYFNVDLSLSYKKYLNYRILLLEIIKSLLEQGVFSKSNINKVTSGKEKKTDRKEYAKVWQTDNFRVLDQTNEIVSNLLNRIKDPQVKEFIGSFAGYDIDERTDLANIDNFFTTYYKVLKFIENEYLNKYNLKLEDLSKDTMLKIRKLGQYRANGVYFPNEHVLSVDVNAWDSLVHETGHFIHYKLAELLNNGEKYYEIIGLFNKPDKINANKYPALKLYSYILTNLPLFLDRGNKVNTSMIVSIMKILPEEITNKFSFLELNDQISDIVNFYAQNKRRINIKGGYKNYAGTSAEIFARMFDKMVSYKLKPILGENHAIIYTDNAKDREHILYQLDKEVQLAVGALLGRNPLDELSDFIMNGEFLNA